MASSELVAIVPQDYTQLAEVYARVFAGHPWYEISRCSACNDFSSSMPELEASCAKCDTGFYTMPAYPLGDTTAYIQNELGKSGAVGKLIVSARRIFGFGWGYESSSQLLAEKKYSSGEMRSRIRVLLDNEQRLFYVSEVGVVPESQGKGWGRRLTESVIDNRPIGLRRVVLRTNEDSAMRYVAEKLGMKPVVGLNTGIEDVENPRRVLFVGER